ncbi:MAG: aromatic ring-hydroxylating dioxygenase subunit alpha [Nostocales cyanobacterium]|nr:MAG: aromatic ring-hydroxylating dioxygenase subunit alpha [Nostocales cyanobacterium]
MNINNHSLNYSKKPKIFNHPERFVEGWYWVIPSQKISVGEVKPLSILGRELVIYRGEDQQVVILDAFCPHFGAHLGEGTVEGNELRCFFHHWKFDSAGFCVEVPCLEEPAKVRTKSWPTAEKYGLVWVWTGETPQHSLPFIPELELDEFDTTFGKRLIINCHPNIFMINAIDTQHFNTVHKLLSEFNFAKQEINENSITFTNTTDESPDSFLIKLIRPLYKKPVNFSLCYWYGMTGFITIGIGILQFNIMFASRLSEAGKADIQTIFLAKKRQSILGKLSNILILWLSQFVIEYFIRNDAKILRTIQFKLKSPIDFDQAIIDFVNHLENQKALKWENWYLDRIRDGELDDVEKRPKREKWHDELVND